MQRLLFLFVAAFSFIAATAQTADEVINKYITAVGGKEKLESITSLQYVQAMSIPSPQGNFEMNIITIKEKGKLFRNQMSNDMIGESYALVTDTATWVRKPANPFTGEEGGLEKVKAEDLKGMNTVTQLDCAGFFPELMNYAAKGYTAEVTGDKKINGRDSYKLKLKKDKAETIFFIDKETGLVNSYTLKGDAVAAMGAMMGGAASEISIDFDNYQEVKGVKIPGVMKITTMMGEMSIPIKDVKINEAVDAKWYKAE
jgi:outer membrane lipoprotein-sorting protein